MEVFLHIEQIKRHEATERLWSIRAACAPSLKKQDFRSLAREIRIMSEFTWFRRKSPYDEVDDQTRRLMIGSALSLGGEKWLEEHRRQLQWLVDNNVTPAQCMKEHAEWLEEQRQFGGWRRNGDADDGSSDAGERRDNDPDQRATRQQRANGFP